MKWNHILDTQPGNERSIIQVDAPYQGHYSMGMRQYTSYCTFQEYLDWIKDNDLPQPDFWWVYAEDFPFPDRKVEE